MKGKISVFAPKSSDWTTNGLAILMPTSCEVSEQAGGEYELEMVHPCDEWGKWQYLTTDSIIRVPVPTQVVPAIETAEIAYWRVKTTVTANVIVYAKPLIYTYTISPSGASAWVAGRAYTQGTYVTYNGGIFRYTGPSNTVSTVNPAQAPYWVLISPYDPTQSYGEYTGGGKVGELEAGAVFLKLGTYNSDWIRVRIADGIEGYVKTTFCEFYEAASDAFPARTITTQCFRVYKVTTDSEDASVTVNARHISYDLYSNCIGACEVQRATPATAIMMMQTSLQMEDVRTIATNITDTTVTADWSWNNAVFALLDEEVGIVKQLNAKLIRDNNDIFILKNDTVDNGFTIEYGKNLVGANWYTDIEDVITRILPRAQRANGTTLLLPEAYIDSEFIDDYAAIRMEVLDSGLKIGADYEDETGTTITLTEEDCYRIMRKQATRRYLVDNADLPEFSLEVEFVMLGDTEEYKQYKDLQKLAPYDTVRIKHTGLGFDTKMQMRAYTWDAINLRYTTATFEGMYDNVHQPELLTRPEEAMTAANQYGLKITGSNWRSSATAPFKAWNYDLTNGWEVLVSQTKWIQIELDYPFTQISLYLYSRNTTAVSHPKTGYVEGSMDGNSWTQIATFEDWAKITGGLIGIINCENDVGYKYVRLTTTAVSANTEYMSIGYMYLTGRPIYD